MTNPQLHTLFSRAEDGLFEVFRTEQDETKRNIAAGAWLVCRCAAMLCRGNDKAAVMFKSFADGVLNVDDWLAAKGKPV